MKLYYIYRNLRAKQFSVKYDGRVVDRCNEFQVFNPELKVNESGRQRVIKEKQKNVHAYVTAEKYSVPLGSGLVPRGGRVYNKDGIEFFRLTYNPYINGSFFMATTGQEVNCAVEIRGVKGDYIYARLPSYVDERGDITLFFNGDGLKDPMYEIIWGEHVRYCL